MRVILQIEQRRGQKGTKKRFPEVLPRFESFQSCREAENEAVSDDNPIK